MSQSLDFFEPFYVENLEKWITFSRSGDFVHFFVKYDDYPQRRFWEKGVFYDYDLILYSNKETSKSAIVFSYWDVMGRVVRCPDCAMTKCWYAKIYDYSGDFKISDKQISEIDLQNLKEVLEDSDKAIPRKVRNKFFGYLKDWFGFTLYDEKEIEKI